MTSFPENRPLVARRLDRVELITRAGPHFVIFTTMTPAEALALADWLRERASDD